MPTLTLDPRFGFNSYPACVRNRRTQRATVRKLLDPSPRLGDYTSSASVLPALSTANHGKYIIKCQCKRLCSRYYSPWLLVPTPIISYFRVQCLSVNLLRLRFNRLCDNRDFTSLRLLGSKSLVYQLVVQILRYIKFPAGCVFRKISIFAPKLSGMINVPATRSTVRC